MPLTHALWFFSIETDDHVGPLIARSTLLKCTKNSTKRRRHVATKVVFF